MDNLINCEQLRSRARWVIRDSKESWWRAYISSHTHHTYSRDVWHKVRKIKGTWCPFTISGLLIHVSIQTAQGAIVDELAAHFVSVSSSNHYSSTFQLTKVKEESKVLDFSTTCSNYCNLPFTPSELQSSHSCAHNTAPGPDQIHNSMLKSLPATALHFLLSLYNGIWLHHTLPDRCQEVITIPIAKPGKHCSLSSSYHPISLTSWLCTIMERMVQPSTDIDPGTEASFEIHLVWISET